jgi:hypothetical protein
LTDRLPGELALTLNVQKVKDGDAGYHLTATLRKVILDTDRDGEEISTLVVDRIETGLSTAAQRHQKSASRRKLPESAKRSLAALKRALRKHGTPPDGEGFPDGVTRVVSAEIWREEAMAGEVSNSDKPDAKRRAFNRSVERLREDGQIDVFNESVWLAAA